MAGQRSKMRMKCQSHLAHAGKNRAPFGRVHMGVKRG